MESIQTCRKQPKKGAKASKAVELAVAFLFFFTTTCTTKVDPQESSIVGGAVAPTTVAQPTAYEPSSIPATMEVAGQLLPILDEEPAEDDNVFVVRAATPLAARYRSELLNMEPEPWEREHLEQARQGEYFRSKKPKAPSMPTGFPLHLVRVRRDTAGRLFLYRPCDGQSHSRDSISDGMHIQLGGEPWEIFIRTIKTDGDGFVIEHVTEGLPPFIADRVRLRPTAVAGLFEESVPGKSSGMAPLLMTRDEAAKLDIVVRLCRTRKLHEFDFNPGSTE